VRLTGMKASSYNGLVEMQVITARSTGRRRPASPSRDDSSRVLYPKNDFEILAIGQESALRSVGCENTDWPF
jgi:hypothetical protein